MARRDKKHRDRAEGFHEPMDQPRLRHLSLCFAAQDGQARREAGVAVPFCALNRDGIRPIM
jgi:hypothetical protein